MNSIETHTDRRAKLKSIGLWSLLHLTAAAFLLAGFAKLSGQPMMVETFEKVGMGQWFRYVTGVIEVASAVLLVIPRLVPLGAFLLLGTMTGAVMTHLFLIGGSPAPAFVLGVFTAIILWARFDTVRAWIGGRSGWATLTAQ